MAQTPAEILDAILISADRDKSTIGLVNGEAAAKRMQGFKGMSDKAVALPNRGICANVDLDLAGLDTAEQREAMKLVSRLMTRLSEKRLPEGLARSWRSQADSRRLFSISIDAQIATPNHRNHAVANAAKRANAIEIAQPWMGTALRLSAYNPTPVDQPEARAKGLDYADHHAAGAPIGYAAMDVPRIVDWLNSAWETGFVGSIFAG